MRIIKVQFNSRGLVIAPPGSMITGPFVILGNDENSGRPNPDAGWWFNVSKVDMFGVVELNDPSTLGNGLQPIGV